MQTTFTDPNMGHTEEELEALRDFGRIYAEVVEEMHEYLRNPEPEDWDYLPF